MAELEGRTALVTGGARRIGRAICLALARSGARVALTYRHSLAEARETCSLLRSQGVEAEAFEVDLESLESCDRLLHQVLERFSQVDILVNNASSFPRTPLPEAAGSREVFCRHLEPLLSLHLRVPLYLGIQFGWRMKERGWGRIVNLTDRVITRGQAYPHWSLYLATKYGLYGVSQALAVELAPQVTVNSVAPGLALAPRDMTPDQIQAIESRIPLGRQAGAAAIAEDVLHLIRSEAKTGSVIVSDGGAGLTTG